MNRKGVLIILVTLLMLIASGCATSFQGSAMVKEGPAGCQKKCKAWGLQFGGMVALGEYSSACICNSGAGGKGAAAGALGGAVGVLMQQQNDDQ